MKFIKNISLTSIVMLGLASGMALASGYQDEGEIREKLDAHLAELGVTPDVAEIGLFKRYTFNVQGERIVGYDAWVRLNSCTGHLVFNLSVNGFVRHIYTTDDCHVAGVESE